MTLLTVDAFLDSTIGGIGGDGLTDKGTLHVDSHGNFGALQAERTSKKDYLAAYIFANITSNSQQDLLHECPRKWQISKLPRQIESGLSTPNVDFSFGHSVGAGVQTYIATGSKNQALLSSFLAWNADTDLDDTRKKKSIWWAALAVEKFIVFWDTTFKAEWEIAFFIVDGVKKHATEVTFFLDTENDFFHVSHVDVILQHKISGRFMVLELKTTSLKTPDEAQYGNSPQALGYSVILDKIAVDLKSTATFEVLYLVYTSTERKWVPFLFTKSRIHRAEWLQDLLLDHASIATYTNLGFFPKRGEACWSFFRRCSHYGICDMSIAALGANSGETGPASKKQLKEKVFKWYSKDKALPEKIDFYFSLSDLTTAILRT